MMRELRSCYRCGLATEEAVGRCPRCRQPLRTATQVRRSGWLLLAVGVFLAGFMGTVTYHLTPMLLRPGEEVAGGSSFTGTWEQALIIFGLLGLVIMSGLASALSGLWQIVTGRRNRRIFLFAIWLFVLLALAAWVVPELL